MNQFGQSREEHAELLGFREQEIADNAVLSDMQLAQEHEIFQLKDQWDRNWKDIQQEAAEKKKSTIQFLNDQIPTLEKNGRIIPAHAAMLSLKNIYLKDDKLNGIEATNMVKLTEADMALVGYGIQAGVMASFNGFKDLYEPGTTISSYPVDSTQRPSERDPRLRMRKYIARLPLAMTAARVVPETKSTFKITEYVHTEKSNNGVHHSDEMQTIAVATATVKEWKEGMLPCRGALGFSMKNINEGEYTLQALNTYAAEWSISVERVMVKACTDKIKDGATEKTLNFSSLSQDDRLKIALAYTFSNVDYMITTLAIGDEATYTKYAKAPRGDDTQESSPSDLGTATGRDNFRSAADRDVFAHPDGQLAVDTILGWDASETINVHMLGMNQTSSMERKQNPDMYCFYWGVEFGTAFERESGDPRILFN